MLQGLNQAYVLRKGVWTNLWQDKEKEVNEWAGKRGQLIHVNKREGYWEIVLLNFLC